MNLKIKKFGAKTPEHNPNLQYSTKQTLSSHFLISKQTKGTQRNTNTTNTLKTKRKKIKKFGVETPEHNPYPTYLSSHFLTSKQTKQTRTVCHSHKPDSL